MTCVVGVLGAPPRSPVLLEYLSPSARACQPPPAPEKCPADDRLTGGYKSTVPSSVFSSV